MLAVDITSGEAKSNTVEKILLIVHGIEIQFQVIMVDSSPVFEGKN